MIMAREPIMMRLATAISNPWAQSKIMRETWIQGIE
jgi:hypothetical protein